MKSKKGAVMEFICKQGKLVISDRSVQCVAPFGNTVWSVQRNAIIGVSLKRGFLMDSVVFQASGSVFQADSIAKKKAQEILSLFN